MADENKPRSHVDWLLIGDLLRGRRRASRSGGAWGAVRLAEYRCNSYTGARLRGWQRRDKQESYCTLYAVRCRLLLYPGMLAGSSIVQIDIG